MGVLFMKNNILLFASIFLIIITVIYSNIDKTVALSDSNTSSINTIYMDNLKVLTKDTGNAYLKNGNISYDVNFNKPGEKFTFSFDIVNPLSNDMYIRKLKVTGIDNISFLSYYVKDINGSNIKSNEIISKNNRKKVFITIDYSEDYLPLEDTVIDLGLDIDISM
jgi:hypothetical protein